MTPRIRALTVTVAAVGGLVLAGCGATPAPSTTKSAGTSPTPTQSSPSQSASPGSSSGQCTYLPTPAQPAARKVSPPPGTPLLKPNTLTMTTNFGAIKLSFAKFDKSAPCAVSNFISLAKQGYFDTTPCHRITDYPTFKVLQCGDPTGKGTGGPGYSFASELSAKDQQMAAAQRPSVYPAGIVAMANTGQPNSEGSQFFLVFGDTQLPPAYTKFAMMDAPSVKVIEKIAANGLIPNPAMGPQDGAPKKPVIIKSVK